MNSDIIFIYFIVYNPLCILFSINQDGEDRALMRKLFHGPMAHTTQVHITNIGGCIRGMFPNAEMIASETRQ